MIPYGRQDISQADIDAVTAVLKSDFLTQGPAVPEFEAALCAATGAAHALAMNSATSALHVACAALGLGPGDWLWTSPISFVASANCGLYCGAQVDFVDIDPKSFNMCPEALARKLEQAERDGTLPKVIVPVHLCGQSCDMERIGGLARRYGVKVIEDASHAIGGSYQGLPVGAGTYSDIVVLSFHPVKIVTTAEGGAALTNDPELAHRMGLLRSHGITRDPARMTHESDGPWYYQQVTLGWNYRMTDLQAALGTSQMTKLSAFVDKRHEHADAYDAALAPLPLTTPWRQPETRSALHLYVVQVDAARRRAVFEGLRARGVGVNVHYIPIHLQPHYRAMGFSQGDFPAAEAYYARAISLPMFPTLSAEDRHYVVTSLAQELGA
mgnify:CR=1 FL=1